MSTPLRPVLRALPACLAGLLLVPVPSTATERPGPEDVDADEIVQAESHREMDMMTREPDADQRLDPTGAWRGLLLRSPSTRDVEELDREALIARAASPKTGLVTGRLDVVEMIGPRSAWVQLGERRLLLVVEPGDTRQTLPLVGEGQTLSIDTARVVPGGSEVAKLLAWSEVPRRVLRRESVLLLSTDAHVQVERTVEMPGTMGIEY